MPSQPATAIRTFWSLGLSPAQRWIAEARRSRDLLAGSRILAWLMGRLLVHLQAKEATVRLPEMTEEDLRSLAEKFSTALVDGSSGVSNHASGWMESPLEVAAEVFRELETKLESLWNELRGEVEQDARGSANEVWKLAGPAIGEPSCPLQLTWALQETATAESEGLLEVDAVFAAVKRSRPIAAHDGGATVRKCGQCGKREALGGPDPEAWRQFQDRLAGVEEVKRGLRFDANEYLCPVCALRRFAGYMRKDAFPSTSAIAAAEWLWKIRSVPDLCAALQGLEMEAKTVPGYEADWVDRAPFYYRRSLERELRRARKEKDENAEDRLGAVQAALRHLEKEIRRYDQRHPQDRVAEKPPGYLAVVMFDGDDMGRNLRQDLETLPGEIVAFQRRLGELFREEERWGHPFYLGGDEGLILAPVGQVLELAERIRELWSETEGKAASAPTLSMGIALFDRERPLGAAIETARRSLERAKLLQRPRKNGLAISVQTASGSEWTAVAHWGESWQRIRDAVDLIRGGTLASGWAHDVERFLRPLGGGALRAGGETRAAIREEVKRITARRSPSKEGARAEVWEKLRGDAWWQEQPSEEEIATLADHLHLAAFLASASGAA
jgi:CRISPR-associated protein Cmr2